MKVTIVLCTYNRCRALHKALESIAASVVPDSISWDVLAVDNNSNDRTREVIEDFCRRDAVRFHYMFVSRQGKSHALNSALDQVSADVIAFTDDDVTVEPTWLQNLIAPLRDNQWSGAAGRIRPGHDFSPPRWLATDGPFNLTGSLVQFDQGETEGKLNQPAFGANMAFRSEMFEKYGNFRTDLGRKGRGLIGNEDTEFCERLMAHGELLCYVPTAVVNHPIPPEKLTKAYMRKYWFSYGRSLVRQDSQRLPLWKIPLRYLRRLKRMFEWMSRTEQRWFLTATGRFFYEVFMCQTAGEFFESYCIRLAGRQGAGRHKNVLQVSSQAPDESRN